jgi:hypothetical protein
MKKQKKKKKKKQKNKQNKSFWHGYKKLKTIMGMYSGLVGL